MGILVGLLVVVAVAALAVRHFMGRAMYQPGSASRRIAAAGGSLDPAGGADGERPWPVAPGIALHHFATGVGEDVLVVHGGPGIAPEKPWRAAEQLPGLRLHFYHQRGCGRSTRPLTTAPEGSTWRRMVEVEARLGLAEQVADLERIRRLLGKERLVLVGHSFGAVIASLYAVEFPGRVRALVLVAPAPLFTMPVADGDLFTRIRARLPADGQAAFDAYLREYFDFPALMRLDEERLSAFFSRLKPFYAAASPLPREPGRIGPEDSPGSAPAPLATPAGAPGGWMQLAAYLSLGRHHDWRDALRAVTAPVLVVHGEQDLQPLAASERITRLFPDGRLSLVPGAGHFPFDQQPVAFAAAVREFLASLAGRAGAGAGAGAGAATAAGASRAAAAR